MKANSISKLTALVLAILMSLSLAACGSDPGASLDDIGIGDEITAPAPEGFTLNWGSKDDKDADGTNTAGEAKASKAMTKNSLKPYGELVTVVKSVSKPTAGNSKNVQDTNYGKIDWSMAAQGYIEFTAKGQDRTVILQGPNGNQIMTNVSKNTTAKLALTDGTGKYQYAIANMNNGKNSVSVQYKNSFSVNAIDSELAPYLVSTPYGDYENAPNAVKQADELWDAKKTQLQNVKAIAKWVGDAVEYDTERVAANLNVYVNPDTVIENGYGVCNEKAKLLTAMLRSQGIPAYYQYGKNAQGGAHAWVVAWVELSSETKNGTTTSTGTWITIEAIGGGIQTKTQAANNYTVGTYRN